MTKVQPNYTNGIEFIRICDLPFTQRQKFSEWIPLFSTFTLQVYDEIFDDCVIYTEYEFWYETQNFDLIEEQYFF